MMVDILTELGTNESQEELSALVEDFVDRLTGKQTIYQMIQLGEEIRKRGGEPLDPVAYKHRFHDLLLQHIQGRTSGLKSGTLTPEACMVPGTTELLSNLKSRGLTLYLASGTDVVYVQDEVALLGLTHFFEERIYGALDQYQNFSKAMVIQNILKTHGLKGEELLGFGDGYVEIENVKEVGGIAIGVASDEARREGIDAWKRERLLHAGADFIIPDYREQDPLIAYLCDPG